MDITITLSVDQVDALVQETAERNATEQGLPGGNRWVDLTPQAYLRLFVGNWLTGKALHRQQQAAAARAQQLVALSPDDRAAVDAILARAGAAGNATKSPR